jgi:hypothetical protein
MAATMKIAVIRGVTLSSLVVVTNVSNPVASETSEEMYHTAWQHILEDSNLHGGSHFYLFRLPRQRKNQENCTLLSYFAASSGNFLPTFQDNLSVPSSRVENPKSHRGKPKLVMRERFQFYKQCQKNNVSGK